MPIVVTRRPKKMQPMRRNSRGTSVQKGRLSFTMTHCAGSTTTMKGTNRKMKKRLRRII
ncbi:hypothetical protein D3C86_2127190 [compost metagenome]